MAELKLADHNPVTMVGDGKRPNRYWVTASTDFEQLRREDGVTVQEYAEGLMRDHGIESIALPEFDAVFDNYAEAAEYAEKVCQEEMPPEPRPGRVNRITIEDRLTGEVGCIVLLARPRKWGGVSFEFDNTLPEEVEKF